MEEQGLPYIVKKKGYPMKINRIALNLAILSIIILTTAVWTITSNNSAPTHNANNYGNIPAMPQAPDFTYTTITREKSSLYAHKGKTILLHFWASWCAPCLVEFPTLLNLANDNKNNLIILAISVDEDKSKINRFIKQLNRGIPKNVHIIQDSHKIISQDLYQTLKLPETFVISPNLKILEKVIGPQGNWNSPAWKKKFLNSGKG